MIEIDGYNRGNRLNANNIDLNRNFPSILAVSQNEVISTTATMDQSHRIQPETAAIINWSKLYPFVLSANLHSGSKVVNYPFDVNTANKLLGARTPDDKTFKMVSLAFSKVYSFFSYISDRIRLIWFKKQLLARPIMICIIVLVRVQKWKTFQKVFKLQYFKPSSMKYKFGSNVSSFSFSLLRV